MTGDLRRRIQDIQASDLDAMEKAQQIQQLFTPCNTKVPPSIETDEPSIIPSYHDEAEKVFGCKHYARDCVIKAKCCGKYFVCRLCHDEQELDHKIDRFSTELMKCQHCFLEQPVSQFCINTECSAHLSGLAKYYCGVCKLWDSRPNVSIFHCYDCSICRVGSREDTFHCHGCGICIPVASKDQHKCSSSANGDCSLCLESLFSSTTSITTMECGHYIHQKCLTQLCSESRDIFSFRCPVCQKWITDGSNFEDTIQEFVDQHPIDKDVLHQLMKASGQDGDLVAEVYCFQCETHSSTCYHPSYMKCGNCGSYNTTKA
ncbi:hypothetical protein P9112_008167 [Eukaryota sp. TZLM1-RC]